LFFHQIEIRPLSTLLQFFLQLLHRLHIDSAPYKSQIEYLALILPYQILRLLLQFSIHQALHCHDDSHDIHLNLPYQYWHHKTEFCLMLMFSVFFPEPASLVTSPLPHQNIYGILLYQIMFELHRQLPMLEDMEHYFHFSLNLYLSLHFDLILLQEEKTIEMKCNNNSSSESSLLLALHLLLVFLRC